MNKHVTVAVVGAGMAGQAHAYGYRNATMHPELAGVDVRLAAIADFNEDLARSAAARYGFAAATTDLDAVLSDDAIDAVSLALPNFAYADVIPRLIAAGKHVLAEKPLGRSAAEAHQFATAADAAGLVHGVGFSFRRLPAVEAIAQIVASGGIGGVRHAAAWYLTDYAATPVSMFNAGSVNWQQCGAVEYFGQDETIAGVAAGKRLASEGAKHVLCVLHAQGQIQLEDRCAGVKQGLGSEGTMSKLYVNGESPPDELSTMTTALTKDRSVDAVITLDAQVALIALQALQQAHSTAKLHTFDTSSVSIAKIKSGAIRWAVDQQPYLQGYEAVDSLWLYLANGNVLGGGQAVLTGPSFIDAANVAKVAQYAQRGTR